MKIVGLEAMLARARSDADLRGGGADPVEQLDRAQRSRARFDGFLDAHDVNGATLLEVHCGTGAFLTHLEARGIRAAYTGIDLSPQAVALCRERHPQATVVNGYFLQYEPDWPFDYVVLFGLEAARLAGLEEAVRQVMGHAFSLCVRAAHLAFDLRPPATLPPHRLLEMGRSIAPHAAIREAPVPHEVSVTLGRRPEAGKKFTI